MIKKMIFIGCNLLKLVFLLAGMLIAALFISNAPLNPSTVLQNNHIGKNGLSFFELIIYSMVVFGWLVTLISSFLFLDYFWRWVKPRNNKLKVLFMVAVGKKSVEDALRTHSILFDSPLMNIAAFCLAPRKPVERIVTHHSNSFLRRNSGPLWRIGGLVVIQLLFLSSPIASLFNIILFTGWQKGLIHMFSLYLQIFIYSLGVPYLLEKYFQKRIELGKKTKSSILDLMTKEGFLACHYIDKKKWFKKKTTRVKRYRRVAFVAYESE